MTGQRHSAPPREPEPVARFLRQAALRWTHLQHRAYDAVLCSRGFAFEGTPAATPQDISNFITHAAFCHLRGAPPPRVLSCPGYGRTAWFADPRIARKMAARHGVPSEPGRFQEVLADIPTAWVSAPCFTVQSGTIAIRGRPGGVPYATTIAGDCRPDRQGMRCGVVRVQGQAVFLAVFHRRRGSALFKLSFVGTHPDLKCADKDTVRAAKRAIYRSLVLAGSTPGLSIDFIGTISSEAARLGCSIFRRLRQREIRRLRGLKRSELKALYPRVANYRYPQFDDRQQVRPPAMTLPLARETRRSIAGAGRNLGRRLFFGTMEGAGK